MFKKEALFFFFELKKKVDSPMPDSMHYFLLELMVNKMSSDELKGE